MLLDLKLYISSNRKLPESVFAPTSDTLFDFGCHPSSENSKKLQSFVFTHGLMLCSYHTDLELTVDNKLAVSDVLMILQQQP